MAGPNFIHYNTTTDIVSGVFTTSKATAAGEAEVNETHPVFIPPVTSKKWQRTGVNTYVLIGSPSFPSDEEILQVGSSTDNAVARWDGTDGSAIKDSGVLVDNSNIVTIPSLSAGIVKSSSGGVLSTPSGIDDLSDVDTITVPPGVGHLLKWDGSKWVPTVSTSIPGTQTWMMNGGIRNAGTNSTEDLGVGEKEAGGGCVAYVAGELIALSVAIVGTRTAGTLTAIFVINSVGQTGAGQTTVINAANPTKNFIEVIPPIPFVAGARLQVRTTTVGYNASGTKNAAVCAFIRNTA
jgi:hypothetical protein